MNWVFLKDRKPPFEPSVSTDEEKETSIVDILLSNGEETTAWYNTNSGWENMEKEFKASDIVAWREIEK